MRRPQAVGRATSNVPTLFVFVFIHLPRELAHIVITRQMRCKNCGWPNEPGIARCTKCNTPLGQEDAYEVAGYNGPDPETNLQSTLRDVSSNEVDNPPVHGASTTCKACGYPLPEGAVVCPMCGTAVGSQRRVTPQFSGTINPWANPHDDGFFTLRRVKWQNEKAEYEPHTFSGDEIILNRSNTDPDNTTITSRQQARITKKADGWYIENLSAQQTTLVRVERPTLLCDGDIIVLGNRMFEFKKG